jgi:hypothetical protein
VDRKGEAQAEKALAEANAEVKKLQAALAVATQRDADAQHQAEVEGEELALAESYDWLGGYAPMVAQLLEARDGLKALEDQIREKTRSAPRRLRVLLQHGSEKVQVDGIWTRRTINETEFDVGALQSVPLIFGTASDLTFGERVTIGHCQEAAERLAELADACRAGKHADIAVTGAQRQEERQERRRQRAEEYQAKLAEEQAARDKAKADRERAEGEKLKRPSDTRSTQDIARQSELSGEAAARGEQLSRGPAA